MNRVRILGEGTLRMAGGDKEYATELPRQVHEILLRYGDMENPVLTHEGKEAIEVSRKDWIYTVLFTMEGGDKKVFLKCKGLDTRVDIFLNGKHIGKHEDMFYPFITELEEWKEGKNTLTFYFHSSVQYLENLKEREEWRGKIPRAHYLRKAPHDFEDFLGIKPYFPGVGIFDDIELWECGNCYLEESRIRADLEENGRGKVEWELKYNIRNQCHVQGRMRLADIDGHVIHETTESLDGQREKKLKVFHDNPHLWWPVGYGEQKLYIVTLELLEDNQVVESKTKRIGFRRLEVQGDFDFKINGKGVRLWGANLVPLTGMTHVFDEKKAGDLICKAVQANMNMLRFWGGGEPYPEKLYDMADEAGILVWTEMFHKWGMYPDTHEYMEQYKREMLYMLDKTQGHPCVIIWSGGNESYMGAQLDFPGQPYIGEKIFKMYGEMVKENTDCFYIENSPAKGAFQNDPREGDFHGWNHLWYIPYDKYPVFFSENSRVSVPAMKSMKKYIPDKKELWPYGFQARLREFQESLFPPAWQKLKAGPEPYWCSPVEQFYDADTPEELIYKCGGAHAQFMKRTAERLKRGRPVWKKQGEQICKGQLIWKFNDTWPQIFCSLLDYDSEPGYAYYAVKRGFEPIQVSFAIEDNITIWGVNDTGKDFRGTMEFVLFSPISNTCLERFEEKAVIPSSQSVCICDLDRLGQFKRENLLYACLKDEAGNMINRNYEFVEIERNFYFPDAKLSLKYENEELVIGTDKFARCIELGGNKEGDEFGFFFEDNYFDLLPFEVRRIKVKTQKKDYEITAKTHYSQKVETLRIIQQH